ncbi:MAG: murein biosynthesis integral membrane protein MurJ [Chloroflexi bacterium]|nr:murein biosynthesis integral membrane protein MurJ [Chloroflexota bacterium]MBK8930720.1 murein biosynthesis integral membrane protein MurJ [Chloroflexota bacterium]MBP7045052.1 murein biosynthesis integral membrane protein MurJ [Chloroflexota bacterium]
MSATETEENKLDNGRSQVLRAAGLVSVAVMLSRVVGLVRDMVTLNYLGTETLEANAYAVASRFPEAIFMIVAGGAIGSAFIPTFSAYFVRQDEPGAWRLFSSVINLITLVVAAIAVLAAIFAAPLIQFFYADQITLAPELLPLTVTLMRVMLFSTVIFAASGVIMGALNARQHFLLPALAPTIYNLGIIAGAVLWVQPDAGPTQGKAMGLAVGTVLGALGHFLIQLPGLAQKKARYAPIVTVRDPGVIQVLKLMAPRVLGLSFSEINKFIILFLTGTAVMALGSLPAINVAFRIINLPLGILGIALGIAAFPTLSTLAARHALDDMRVIITDSLRLLLFLGFPITVLLLLLSQPTITLLFERGLFNAESTEFASAALFYLSLGLIALMMLEVIARAFYALSDTLTPVLAGGAQIAIMAVLSLWLSQKVFPQRGLLPLGGLALGFSLSNYFEVALLFWLLRRKMGRLEGRALLDGSLRMGLAAGVMTAVTLIALAQIPASPWWQMLVGSVVGGLAYLLACAVLRVKELEQVVAYGRRRFSR